MAKIPGEKPQYLKLYENIRKQIIEGRYQPGDILPSESQLHNKYGVTQPVIRQALALLVEEGYIKKHQGKGSIVQVRPVGVGIMSVDGRDITSGKDSGFITKIIRGPEKTILPDTINFQKDPDEKNNIFYVIERLRFVSEIPVFYECIYVPDDSLKDFEQLNFQNASFYETIREKYGIRILSSFQKFQASKADEKISGLMNLPVGYSILILERKFATNRKGFYIYSSLKAVTDTFILYSRS